MLRKEVEENKQSPPYRSFTKYDYTKNGGPHSPISANNRISEISQNSNNVQRTADTGAFKQILKEKLDNLYFTNKNQTLLKENQNYEIDICEDESDLSNTENRDLQMYLEEDEDNQ